MRTTSPLRGLPPSERTLPALLELQAERHGERPLVRRDGLELSVAELRDRVAGTAGRLVAAGIGPGDTVATMSENRVELLELWLGCAWLGAVAVPVNTALRAGQLEHVLRDAGARLAIVEPELLAPVETVRRELPDLEALWRLDEYPGARRSRCLRQPPRPATRARSCSGSRLSPTRRPRRSWRMPSPRSSSTSAWTSSSYCGGHRSGGSRSGDPLQRGRHRRARRASGRR